MALQQPQLTVLPADDDLDEMSPVELRILQQRMTNEMIALARQGAPLRQRLYLQQEIGRIQERIDLARGTIEEIADFTESVQRELNRVIVETVMRTKGLAGYADPKHIAMIGRVGQSAIEIIEQIHLGVAAGVGEDATEFRSGEVSFGSFVGHLAMGRLPEDLARKAKGGRR